VEVIDYKGCKFPNILKVPTKLKGATFSTGDKRYTLDPFQLDFDVTDGSYRYGREFQIHAWNTQPAIPWTNRADHNGYSRIEIPIPYDLALQVLEKLLKNLWSYTWKGHSEQVI